jgi:hypothetical protein
MSGAFRDGDRDPIGIEELKRLNLREMPEDVSVPVLDDYFPETTLSREGEFLVCEIQEHLYTKYWEHKVSAYAYHHATRQKLLDRDQPDARIKRSRRRHWISASLRISWAGRPGLSAPSPVHPADACRH